MKKLIQIVFCLLISFSGFGQEMKDSTLKNKNATYRRVSFGFFINPSYSYRTIKNNTSQQSTITRILNPMESSDSYTYYKKNDKAGLGLNIGTKVLFQISNRFSVLTGFSYDQLKYGTKVIDSVFFYHWSDVVLGIYSDTVLNKYRMDYKFGYLSLPIGIRYKFITKKDVSFYLDLEGSLSVFQSVRARVINNNTDETIVSANRYVNINEPYLLNLYYRFALGFCWQHNNNSFACEPYFKYGITSVDMGDKKFKGNATDGYYRINGEMHLYQIGISFAINHNFKKKSKT